MRKTTEERQSHTETDNFQQRLVDHVEMVYSVALRLGGNPHVAERLTRSTMSRIWRQRNTLAQTFELKAELLHQLRLAFLDKQRIDLQVKMQWGGAPHTANRSQSSEIETSRSRDDNTEDSILVVAF